MIIYKFKPQIETEQCDILVRRAKLANLVKFRNYWITSTSNHYGVHSDRRPIPCRTVLQSILQLLRLARLPRVLDLLPPSLALFFFQTLEIPQLPEKTLTLENKSFSFLSYALTIRR
jgi:hypothetical protein